MFKRFMAYIKRFVLRALLFATLLTVVGAAFYYLAPDVARPLYISAKQLVEEYKWTTTIIGGLWALLLFVLGLLLARRKEILEDLLWGQTYYLSPSTLVARILPPGERLAKKREYYETVADNSRDRDDADDTRQYPDALLCVAQGFHARWKTHDVLEKVITSARERRPIHICVSSAPRRGRSTTLASVAVSLAANPDNQVLWLASAGSFQSEHLEDGRHPFNCYRLLRYAHLCRSARQRFLGFIRGRQRLVVFVDGVSGGGEQTDQIKQNFLHDFAQIGPRRLWQQQIFLITSNVGEPLDGAKPVQVEVTEDDLTATLKKLKEEPRLIDDEQLKEAVDVWNRKPQFVTLRYNVQNFLLLLFHPNDAYSKEDCNVLQYVAASEVVRTPLPHPLLTRILGYKGLQTRAIAQLIRGGHLKEAGEEYEPDRGIVLREHPLGEAFIDDYYLVDSLPQIYDDIVERILANPTLDRDEGEYLRCLLQRLGRRRHFPYLGLRPQQIAKKLVAKASFPGKLESYIEKFKDVETLAAWAGTLSGLVESKATNGGGQLPQLVRRLCQDIIAGPNEELSQSPKAFTGFCKALWVLKDDDLTRRGLALLRPDLVLKPDEKDLQRDRRPNQILHGYCRLARKLDEFNRLAHLIEDKLRVSLDKTSRDLRTELEKESGRLSKPDNTEEQSRDALTIYIATVKDLKGRWKNAGQSTEDKLKILEEAGSLIERIKIEKWKLPLEPEKRAEIFYLYVLWLAVLRTGQPCDSEINAVCETIRVIATDRFDRTDTRFLNAVIIQFSRLNSPVGQQARMKIESRRGERTLNICPRRHRPAWPGSGSIRRVRRQGRPPAPSVLSRRCCRRCRMSISLKAERARKPTLRARAREPHMGR